MRRRLPVVVLALALVVLACGRPKVRESERYTVTVGQVAVVDRDGAPQAVVTVTRDDCATDRTEVSAPLGSAAGACLKGLTAGSKLDVVRTIWQHPPMSCGVEKGDPNSNRFGPCERDGLRMIQQGTACPKPAAGGPGSGSGG